MKNYRYEVYKSSAEFGWRIKSKNGKVIGDNFGHNTKAAATNGLKAICKSMGGNWEQIKANIDYVK